MTIIVYRCIPVTRWLRSVHRLSAGSPELSNHSEVLGIAVAVSLVHVQ